MIKLSKKSLADVVIRKRKELGLTQQQLSDKTGINRAMLSRLETQDYVPSIPQLESLSEVLEFDVTDVLHDGGNGENLEKVSPLNIAIAGTGYVGLSVATLLAQHNHVTAVDII
ncbi:MAG: helix-turn-helix domain-containing protein, partial [Lachnospiraceae bacterium]|nr:helix-turn-helix domain-containing protein [Lachnospiraceae bacterium]